MADGPRWCKKCKEVFEGKVCKGGHANFMYTVKIPEGQGGAALAAAPPVQKSEPETMQKQVKPKSSKSAPKDDKVSTSSKQAVFKVGGVNVPFKYARFGSAT